MTDPAKALRDDLVARMLAYAQKLAAGAWHLPSTPAGREGCTQYEVVMQRGQTRLLAYRPRQPDPRKPPLLIVYALVNRPYVLDLEPQRSFLRGLLAGQRSLYLVDWGYPGATDRERRLEDYVVADLDACVEAVATHHPKIAPDLLGVCQGGSMSLCHALIRPGRFRKLVLTVTPIDFQCDDFLLCKWLRYVDVDAMVERLGDIPGEILNWAFLALKPLTLSSVKARKFIELMDDPAALATFARMEHWIQDSPDQAGPAFAEFVQHFIRDNVLVNGGLTLDGKAVRVSQLQCPLLNVYAEADHIVPPAASTALSRLVPAEIYTEQAFAGGHIGLFTGHRSRSQVAAAINDWLDGGSHPAVAR